MLKRRSPLKFFNRFLGPNIFLQNPIKGEILSVLFLHVFVFNDYSHSVENSPLLSPTEEDILGQKTGFKLNAAFILLFTA